ncbi:hypothetical protein [Mucilaginibacter paludis]|uniref:Late embryogenesis abundant protein LEA-2 subgroup domain-containing protein n=1 Tax=Mucilaginibacter paludis DSM 18603 TaxID=714943 RepID=H1Y5Q2_9SPHI|nr:hypothetical protein [Mucilaginibacter paludis]EHQ29828.1 hypothetical protein Mucpa_5760 [Mucilaginibacter paludis DSM 18603]
MAGMALALSILALLATFYQAYLQRVHNEKSVKPLPQIDLRDRENTLFIRIQNNGVGPLIVDKLIFTKEQQDYPRIQDCITIDPTEYNQIEITETNKKIVIPGAFLEVFSKIFDKEDSGTMVALFRHELSVLTLKVEGRDIYNNKISIEKSLHWFGRHN